MRAKRLFSILNLAAALSAGLLTCCAAQETRPIWEVAYESLTYIESRPLFSKSRRPPAAMPQAAGAASTELQPGFAMIGYVIGDDGTALAVLRDVSGKVAKRVQLGSNLNGWEVVELNARRVSLRRGETVAHLTLRPQAAPNSSPQNAHAPIMPQPPAPRPMMPRVAPFGQ